MLLVLVGCGGEKSVVSVWFEDQAEARGITFQHQSGSDGLYWMPEIMTGGGALTPAALAASAIAFASS